MRFAACGCVPVSVATMFTISTGCGTRRAGGWVNESSSTRRGPPAAREHWSSSALIQRRAAPMPTLSESVRESVWRVWNETSLRTRASMLEALIAKRMPSTCALRAGACAPAGRASASAAAATLAFMRAGGLPAERRGAVLLGTQPAIQCIQIGVDHWDHDQRQQRRGDDAADDRAAHRRLLLGAFAEAERERQHAEDHRRGGHQDGAQADLAGSKQRLVAAQAAALALVGEVDQQDGVLGDEAHEEHQADHGE